MFARIKSMGKEKNTEIEVARQQLAKDIKSRLAQPSIDTIAARDGMRDCFVSTYLGGVTEGFANFDIHGGPDAISRVVESMFRKRLKLAGASWEMPTVKALQNVKDEVDKEIHFDGLPPELKGVHDQVCTLLIGKARGDLAHHGDRSAVKAEAAAKHQAQTSQTRKVEAPAAVRVKETPRPTPEVSPVVRAMRSAVTAQIERMAQLSSGMVSLEDLYREMAQLSKLMDTEKEVAQSTSH